jgi:hypothetical protein
MQLPDAPAPVVSLLLCYLYTDTLHYHRLTSEELQQLLLLADRWLLPHVVNHCQSYVTAFLLTPATSLEWLLWADEHRGARFSEGVFERALELLAGDLQGQMKGREEEMARLFARPELAMEVTKRATIGG